MKIQINSLVSFDVEQIKISGTIEIGGKALPCGVNKTLDSSIVAQLPQELVESLTASVFGADYSPEELAALAQSLTEGR